MTWKSIHLFVLGLLVVGAQALQWDQINPKFPIGGFSGIAYDGKGTYVMVLQVVGNGFSAFYTDDPSHWEPTNVVSVSGGLNRHVVSLYFVNDAFLLFANATVYISEDGKNFTSQPMNLPDSWEDVQHVKNNSAFTFVSNVDQRYFMASKNGIDWFKVNFVGNSQLGINTLYNRVYTCPYLDNVYYFSEDGVTWTKWVFTDYFLLPSGGFISSIGQAKPGVMVALAESPTIAWFISSYDNENLTSKIWKTWNMSCDVSKWGPYGIPQYLDSVGKYTWLSYTGLFSSHSLCNWTLAKQFGPPNGFPTVVAGDYTFVYTNRLFYTSDFVSFGSPDYGVLASWTNIFLTTGGECDFILHSDALEYWYYPDTYYCVIAQNNSIIQLEQPPWQGPTNCLYQNDIYYFLRGETMYTTMDFINYNETNTTIPPKTSNFMFGNGVWLALVQSETQNGDYLVEIYRSDSLHGTWDEVFAPVGNYSGRYNLAFTNNIFAIYLSGLNDRYQSISFVYWSSSGATWTPEKVNGYFSAFYTAGNLFVATNFTYGNGKTKSNLVISEDAVNWQMVNTTMGTAQISYSQILNLYYVVGNNGQVAVSFDGRTWEISLDYSIDTIQPMQYLAFTAKYALALTDKSGVYIAEK